MVVLDGADVAWPSPDELTKAEAVRKSCEAEIAALTEPTRDVVGDIRLVRFLRFYGGDITKATKGYREFLQWRVRENIETLRKGAVDLSKDDFMTYLDSIRSPFSPPACLQLGWTDDGHMIVFAMPGYYKAGEFVKQRPACHTLDTDLLVVWLCVEWMLKQIDDMSYKRNQMLYTIKVMDASNMGKEKIPILIPELRNFIKTHMPPVMSMYCEHDILILVLNAPFVFRMVWAFASSILAKRQQARVKVFADATAAEPQSYLKALGPPDMWPTQLGGTCDTIPMTLPFAHDDTVRIAEWMARTTPCLVRGQPPDLSSAIAAAAAASAPGPEAAAPEPGVPASDDAALQASISAPEGVQADSSASGAGGAVAGADAGASTPTEIAAPQGPAAESQAAPVEFSAEVDENSVSPGRGGFFCCAAGN